MKTVRTKTGTPDQLRAWLAAADPEAWEAPQPVPGKPGQYAVRYVVDSQLATQSSRATAPAVQRPWPVKRRWSRRRKLVVTGVVSTALLGLAVLGYLAVLWAMAHAALLLGIAVALAVIAAVVLRRLGTGGDCTVIHIRH